MCLTWIVSYDILCITIAERQKARCPMFPKMYEEVARMAGLDEETASRYVRYMRLRWSRTEVEKCMSGYAMEWAERFARGVEMERSDSEGQRVLNEMI